MSELVFLPGEFRISTWFVWSLSQLVRLLPAKQLAISLTLVGEEAAQELLSAYACGIRHFPGSILEQAELYSTQVNTFSCICFLQSLTFCPDGVTISLKSLSSKD